MSNAEPTGNLKQALDDIRAGKVVVLIGAAERRGEGTLTIAAQHCTADVVAYMARHGRGIVSLCLTEERTDALGLRQMTRENTSSYRAAFTVSIEAREGITTGISAADRARTIAVAIDPAARPHDIVSPGHVFPLRARDGGVLARVAHTEGAVDLAALAGLLPAAVICGILTDDGRMAGPDDVRQIAAELGLTALEVEEIVAYRRARDRWVERGETYELATAYGTFSATAFVETYAGLTHLALAAREPVSAEPVAVHEECARGDIFAATDCACSAALAAALEAIGRSRRGTLLYVARDGGPDRLGRAVSAACSVEPGAPSAKALALAGQVARA